jgi:hypothetical protein
MAGGTDKVTPVMTANAAGPYLKVMREFLAQTKTGGYRQYGEVPITYLTHGPYSKNLLTLHVCEDGRKVRNVSKDHPVSMGVVVKVAVYVRKVDGRWKVWNGDDQRVDSCGN